MPTELDETQRRVDATGDRKEALRKEKDRAPGSLNRIEKGWRGTSRAAALTAQWQSERRSPATENSQEQIEESKIGSAGGREYDLNRAAELKYGALASLEQKLEAEQQRLGRKQGTSPLLKEDVGEEDIADVVSHWTGIPVSRLMEGEMERLLNLDQTLHRRVVGQDEAIRVVTEAVIRSEPASRTPARPIGASFFWVRQESAKTELGGLWPRLSRREQA